MITHKRDLKIMTNNLLFLIAWLILSIPAIGDIPGIINDQSENPNNEFLIQQVVDVDPAKRQYGICKSWVEIYGYKCEEHRVHFSITFIALILVTTEDGYILSVQRIPFGRSAAHKKDSGRPVLLLHGLFMDGLVWLINSPEESLGFILADDGYDVWIANVRGTRHSLGHTHFSEDSKAYWDWTWDDIAAYDLPAITKYVYEHTGNQKLHYIGHSLGTLVFLVSLLQPDILEMVQSAVLLCPVAYFNRVRSFLVKVGIDLFVPEIYNRMCQKSYFPFGMPIIKLLLGICHLSGAYCLWLLSYFTGKNCCIDPTSFLHYLEYGVQPSSTKNIMHLAQMIRRGTLEKFDYNHGDENLKHYGQEIPPAYNISAIASGFPLWLGFGGEDNLADGNDGMHLWDSLSFHKRNDSEIKYQVDYGHDDFIFGSNAKTVVYDSVIAFLKIH